MSRCKADPASAGPGSSNMEEQGEGGGEGAEAIETPDQHDLDVAQMAKIIRGGGDGAVKRSWVGGCNRLSKVCGGCNVQRAGLTGRCWGSGSTELDGRLEVPNFWVRNPQKNLFFPGVPKIEIKYTNGKNCSC